MIDQASGPRLIAAATLAGLVLRLAFALLYWTDKPLTHDEREYLTLARSVTEGRGLTYSETDEPGGAQRFGRAPIYPWFLAAIGAGSHDYTATPARVKWTQAVLGAITVWLIGITALRMAGPLAGAAAAAIAAVYPPLIWISAYVLSETLYGTIALATALTLDLALARADAGRSSLILAATAGAMAGAAVLVRPAMLFFLPLAALWLVARRHLGIAVALLVTSSAVIAPWTIRNFRLYDRFVLVASEGGVTFWTGNHPLAIGEGDMAANPAIKRADIEFRRVRPGLTPEQLEPEYYREALGHIREHPGWWLTLVVRKAFYTVVPIGPSYTLHSGKYLIASVVSYLVVLPVALAGVVALRRRRWRLPAVMLLAASSVLVCLIFFPQERFRIPVLDPALIVCAGAACAIRHTTP